VALCDRCVYGPSATEQRLPIIANSVVASLGILPVIVGALSELVGTWGWVYWLVPAIRVLLGLGTRRRRQRLSHVLGNVASGTWLY
jgi:hypothetical protein